MVHKHLRLITLGRTALLTPAGEDAELGKRRRKLALLAVLVLSRRPPTRGALAEMFWGDEDEERARHSLSDALSHLRRVLGRDAVAARRETVELDVAGKLAVDAIELEGAFDARDWERVSALYTGDFLCDVHVSGSDSFERWRNREQDRFRRMFVQAAEAHVLQLVAAGQLRDARLLALRWLRISRSGAAFDALMQIGQLETAPAERRAVLDEAERYLAEQSSERGERASDAMERAMDALRRRVASEQRPLQLAPSVASPVIDAPRIEGIDPAASGKRIRRERFTRFAIAAAVITAVALAVRVGRVSGRDEHAIEDGAPVVAITEISASPGDSSIAWLGDGMREMIAANLRRAQSVGVVTTAQLRDAAQRAGWAAPLGVDHEVELARRVRATWSLSGTVAGGEGGYVADLVLRDARRGGELRRWSVSGTNMMAVADQAAAVVLGAAGDLSPGVRLSQVETSNPQAYRLYVEGQNAQFNGDVTSAAQHFDAAIAADSAFVSAIIARMHLPLTWGDKPTYQHLRLLFDRAASRMTEWDRLEDAQYLALHNGEHARAESLARELVAKYPRDVRAYSILRDVLQMHGQFVAAESALVKLLALDSLSIHVGEGPCAACVGFSGLADLRMAQGNVAGAERAARQWVEVQPSIPQAWSALATVLAYAGRDKEAWQAMQHARSLDSREAWLQGNEARQAVSAHWFGRADTLIARFPDTPDMRQDRADVEAMSLLEQGRPRAALALLDRARQRYGDIGGLEMLSSYLAGTEGDTRRATTWFEQHTYHGPDLVAASRIRADAARAFSWHHALEADAVADHADTTWIRTMADSIAQLGAASYYARDWKLPHHLRGIIAMRGQRWAEATRELEQARFGVGGWTRTDLLLARSELAQHHAERAATVLREGLLSPLDAMGRYVPHTELEYWLTIALQQAGHPDSAQVHAARVRAAWAHAEPEQASRLRELP